MVSVGDIAKAIEDISKADNKETEQGVAVTVNSQKLAKVIYDAITSADVIMPPGSIVVAGSPTTQTNAVPAKGKLI